MVNKKGLSDKEVQDSRNKYGSNKIIEAEPETFWQKFKNGFEDPMIKLLLAIAVIMIIMALFGQAEIFEVVGIIISVLLVTVISAKTEMASDKEYRKLKDSTKKDVAKVYRDGKIVEIEVDDIVVGDLVILQSGDKIPADGILVDGELRVDNSALNGEAEECKKFAVPDRFVYEDKPITGDTFVDKHSLFRGAVVYNGEGILEVKKVGMNTMMGKMAEDMKDDEVMSPLKVKLADLADKISKFGYIGAIIIAVALMGSYVFLGDGGASAYFSQPDVVMVVIKDLLEAVMLAVVIIVMAVPEGLPLMIAIVLMQNTAKMLQHNVLVRKPIGIETAGSLNILFSDKTGTITKGHLEVVEFFDAELKDSYKKSNAIKEKINLCIGKNTGAMFDKDGKVIGGNLTDKALLNFLTKDVFENLKGEIIKSQGFNSANKYSAAQLDKNITVYKGAPERLLAKATKYLDENGKIRPIDKKKINTKIDNLADKAMRVLAFAYSSSDLVDDILPDDLVIVGFVGIRDDVRQEAKDAIKEVQDAGVQVVMITGDRKETAVAIAKDAGLLKNSKDIAITSEELNKMTDDEVKQILPNIRVIARALPTDKSRMVRLAQELNLVCGMTGDGVNDAPALKRADVGFAMGSGTDVAKEAGEIVIIDDNFKSIKDAILYGRTIYNNILKFIKFQLTINVSAVAISAIGPFIGVSEPLKITHILWINLVMDSLGALALGGEPALEKYMNEKPKSRTQSLVSKKMMTQILIMGAWLFAISICFLKLPIFDEIFGPIVDPNNAFAPTQRLTGYFSLFVISAVMNGFNVRGDGINVLEGIKENMNFVKVMGIITVVQVALTFIGGDFFSCKALNLTQWLIVIVLAFTMIPVDMIRKLIVGKEEKQ